MLLWQPAADYGTERFEAHASLAGATRLLTPHRGAAQQAESAPGCGDASTLDGVVGALQRAWCVRQAREEAPALEASDAAAFEALVDAVQRGTMPTCVLQVREAEAAPPLLPEEALTAEKRTRAPRRKTDKKSA